MASLLYIMYFPGHNSRKVNFKILLGQEVFILLQTHHDRRPSTLAADDDDNRLYSVGTQTDLKSPEGGVQSSTKIDYLTVTLCFLYECIKELVDTFNTAIVTCTIKTRTISLTNTLARGCQQLLIMETFQLV